MIVKNFYDRPKQVRFVSLTNKNTPLYGVAYQDYIICGCCGEVLPLLETEIIKEYDFWVDLSAEIKGE